MRRTIADQLREEGGIEALQQILIRLLKRRFGDVPDELSSTILATKNPEQLDEWLDQVVTAQALEDVGIEVPAKGKPATKGRREAPSRPRSKTDERRRSR
jgi:hypothetical protein